MAKRGEKDPKKVIKRKSYYGFSRKYPGKPGEHDVYLIGDSNVMRRRERVSCVAYVALLVLLFMIAFVITSVALGLSEREPGTQVTAVSESVTGDTTANTTAKTTANPDSVTNPADS